MGQRKKITGSVINRKGSLKAEDVYAGILDALQKNVGEIKFVVEDGGKQHFTSCLIDNIFDMLHEVSRTLAFRFNAEIGVADDAN